jgi:xylulokinase
MSVLVLDCGTSALKATAFAPDGTIVARAEAAYSPAMAEHRASPESWWNAAIAAVQDLPPLDFSAIALTGTMENLIPVGADGAPLGEDGAPLGEDGAPLGEALLYTDPSGAPYLGRLRDALEAADAAVIAGNAPEPLMTAFKLGWLREHEPDRFARARWFLPGSKDFLALSLTGRAATDPSCAATTGLMDLRARQWSGPLLDLHGIDRARLPEILPATAIIGPLVHAAAAALDIAPGIPVINGCGDGAATTVGSGAERAEDVSLYLGTSGWVARVAAGESAGPRPFYRLPHPLVEGVIEIAPIISGGAAAQWARETLGLDLETAERLAAEADQAPGEALFLPYLSGERSPFTDLELRAGFIGVSASTGPGALYYAALEGVAFAIATNLAAMGGAGGGTVSLVGGGALSGVWPAIIADVLDVTIAVPSDPVSATSLGAFRIAARALGLGDVASQSPRLVQPRAERRDRIARQAGRFAAATQFLRSIA